MPDQPDLIIAQGVIAEPPLRLLIAPFARGE
jgi:hypothetical protein